MTEQELEKREKALTMAMERMLPDFVKSCRETAGPLLIHQDAFAVDYDEYELLGMAIKFAGLHGKEVRIVGKNGSEQEFVNMWVFVGFLSDSLLVPPKPLHLVHVRCRQCFPSFW